MLAVLGGTFLGKNKGIISRTEASTKHKSGDSNPQASSLIASHPPRRKDRLCTQPERPHGHPTHLLSPRSHPCSLVPATWPHFSSSAGLLLSPEVTSDLSWFPKCVSLLPPSPPELRESSPQQGAIQSAARSGDLSAHQVDATGKQSLGWREAVRRGKVWVSLTAL